MADRAKKISELPVATSAVGADLFIIVANTTGVAVTKQITTNAFSQSFANIVIGAANSTSMGLVTIGNHLSIDDANTGTISVTVANSSTFGVVAQGNNLYINANGYIGAVGANSSTRGVVQIGNNISVSNAAVISVPLANVTVHGVVAQGNNLYINANGYIGVVGANSTTRGVIQVGSNFSVDANAVLSFAANVDLTNTAITNAVFTGNVYMGIAESNAAQLLHFHGTVHSNVIPHTGNNYSLGNTTNQWSAVYIDGIAITTGDIRGAVVPVDVFSTDFAQLQWSDTANTNAWDNSGNTSWIYTDVSGVAMEVYRSGAFKSGVFANNTAVQIKVDTSPLTFKGAAGVPANSSSTGTTGDIAFDSNYIYYCVANNTWKRAALSTW